MEELAAAAGADAIEYRLRHAPPTATALARIELLKKEAGWVTRPTPNAANSPTARFVRGRGFTRYPAIVEVEVDRETGIVRILEAWFFASPGFTVNPDGLLNQYEQAALQGMSRALHEGVTFDNEKVTSVDWLTHPVLKFTEMPKLHVYTEHNPAGNFGGAGETATGPWCAAIGNAIFHATGVRLRQGPLSPERVLAAIKAQQ
jgi:CO/xanthine dehydrogenase Mo-binding subunit